MSSKRGANFSTLEKEKLVQCVTTYKNVIENKRTDSVTGKQKEECWNKIADDFNSDNISTHRSVNSLKTCWANLKKKTRKHVADMRRKRIATGDYLKFSNCKKSIRKIRPSISDGGKSEVSEDPICDRIKGVIDLTATGLENNFDNDQIIGAGTTCTVDASLDQENSGDEDKYLIEALDETLDMDSEFNGNWEKWNPAMLRHPTSQPLLTERNRNIQRTKERKEEEERENSAASPINVNVMPMKSNYKRRYSSESQRRTSAFNRNLQLIELMESKKERVEMLNSDERTKSSLEIEILEVQLEKEQRELEIANKKLLIYDAILNKKLACSVNLQ